NCLRRLVFCAVLFATSAQQQRDGGAEAMAVLGVQVSVIVREGKQRRRASPKGASGRHDRQRQRVPPTVTKRRFRFAALSLTIRTKYPWLLRVARTSCLSHAKTADLS